MRRLIPYIVILAIVAISWSASSQSRQAARMRNNHALTADTTATYTTTGDENNDSLPLSTQQFVDSLKSDRKLVTRINKQKTDIDAVVNFSADDSLILLGTDSAFLYGNGNVDYQTFKLNAGKIFMDMDSANVFAEGIVVDTLGTIGQNPVFSDNGDEYESRMMKYNFRTQRGFVTDVTSEQGEGYLLGSKAKKMEDGSFFIENGRYTTCNDHEHPHFYFQVTRGKMRPQKDIVTGPVYMVLADVPLPLALPFGYFPFSKKYSSGVIFPSFGEDYNKGFYARDGGYYFAFSDYVDLALRGEIYTKGSWGVTARSSYRKRYKFSGAFDISFITTISGEKGAPDYSKMKNFQVVWSHSMDAKANPNMNFSASVNFATAGYSRNDLNSYYSSAFTENTKASTVSWGYRFPGTKWAVAATMNISQRTQDSTLSVSFPNLNVTLSQVAPFKHQHAGEERWYEKIKLSYQGQFQNSLTARQNVFFKKSLINDWRNGLKHNIPISATFSMFKYINISPSINLNDRMYMSKIRRQWDPNSAAEVTDTLHGFYNVFDFNASLAFDTKIYGFWKPMKFLGDKVQMIRHVLTPTVSISGAPDFSAPGWGIYGRYSRPDAQGNMVQQKYNYFSHGIMGSASSGTQGVVSVNLANNLEMKVKSAADSTGVKKISLIENFSIGQSYNFAADSMNWSNVTTSILIRLPKNINLNLQANWDPYTYQLSPSGSPVRVNVPRWKAHKGWVRLASTGTSFSYTFNNDTFRRHKNNDETPVDEEDDDDENFDPEDFAARAAAKRRNSRKNNDTESDADGYAKWTCPWSLTLNYSINYGYGDFNTEKMEYNARWTQNLSFSGSIRPTQNWNFSFSASYDFNAHKIAYMNCSISRDIHCFTMSCSFVPFGPYKSYNFHIAIKSSMLKDIKYDKRSSTTNGIRWY